jgi:hypothetical protein
MYNLGKKYITWEKIYNLTGAGHGVYTYAENNN